MIGDRQSAVIEGNRADLWRRLERPGDPPDPEPLLAALAAVALIEPDQPPGQDPDSEPAVVYRMHPGVAQAIRAEAGLALQQATDTELSAYWDAVARQAIDQEGGELGQLVVTAGLSGQAGTDEAIVPWNVRESIFNIACRSAVALEEWQQALNFNQAVLASKQARQASDWELAYHAFNDIGSLVLTIELRETGQQNLPGTVPEVIAVAEQTEGVRLGELIAALALTRRTPPPRWPGSWTRPPKCRPTRSCWQGSTRWIPRSPGGCWRGWARRGSPRVERWGGDVESSRGGTAGRAADRA